MFSKGVYTKAEQNFIDEYTAYGEFSSGWLGSDFHPEFGTLVAYPKATKSLLTIIARNHDFKNPLYRDAEYARNTRWGTIIAPPMFIELVGQGPCGDRPIPPEMGAFRSSQFGQNFKWIEPVRVGDEMRVYHLPNRIEDITPEGKQETRILSLHETDYHYNQRGEHVAVYNHVRHKIYAAPGAEDDGTMRAGFGFDLGGRNEQFVNNVRWTEPYVYTKEQIAYIDRFYEGEPRRGAQTRWWEDVEVGQTLPEIIWGPITAWDCMGSLATHNETTLNMMEVRAKMPWACPFVDPVTKVSHRGVEIHISPDVCRLIGWYSHSIVDTMINPFLCRINCNWMGDDGMLRELRWRKFSNTCMGDTIIGRARVLRKYIDREGRCMVEIDTTMEDIRGFVTNTGRTFVELPSKAREIYGQEPGEDGQKSLDIDTCIRAGDRIRVKPRGNKWKFPCSFPLEGMTGSVNELPVDVDGYVYVIADDPEISTIDPAAQLGFRMDEVEKI